MILNKKKNFFTIVGAPRTGSNMLVDFLNKQNSIICHSEIFNTSDFYLSSKLKMKINKINKCILIWFRNKTPIFFLNFIFWITGLECNCVGFKILSFQSKKVLTYVFKNKNIKLIILGRRNVLKNYISHSIAFKNNKWINSSNNVKIKVDVDKFLEFESNYFKTYNNFFETAKKNKKSFLFLEYEDLIGDKRIYFYRQIQDFLGLKGMEDLYSSLSVRKQNSDRLIDIVENYEELYSKLKSLPQNKYLD